MVIGAFDHQDPVLAGRIDEDGRDAARRHPLSNKDPRGIDAARREVLDGGLAEQVVADARDHRHARPAKPGGDRLVGALAAVADMKSAAEDGFARDEETGR